MTGDSGVSPKIEAFLRDERPPTPFVVVDVDVVEERYRALVDALPTARVHYAVKANPGMPILRRLVAAGSAFDVASPAEIDLCLAAGASASDISYGNTVKKRADVAYAASVGVDRFTVDAHIRSHSSSQPSVQVAACAAHAPLGYTDTKHSGKTMRVAPSSAASPRSSMALSTVASASRITGVAWTAATHTVSNPGMPRTVTISRTRAVENRAERQIE